jgi:hypothetical protein
MADDSTPVADVTTTPPPAPTPDAAAPQPASTGDISAPSPSAPPEESGNTREALLAHVQKAVPEPRSSQDDKPGEVAGGVSPAPDAKPATAAPSTPPPPDDYSDLPDDPTQEEFAAWKGGAKRRVEKLLGQRNEARREVERLRDIEPQAKAAESVTKYLRDNDIARDDFLLTLELAAAMRRGDFKTFYEGVRPYMQLAEEYLGIALPNDLQQAVQQGQMTTQAARMYSRERMDRALSESQRVRQAQLHDNQSVAAANERLGNAVRDEVNKWEQTTMAADPDYAAKKAAVQDTMWAVVREKGAPQSPEHAVEIAKEAYRRVNERYRSWTPPRRPTSSQPRSTGRTNGAAPEPKTLKEAVSQAVERARV